VKALDEEMYDESINCRRDRRARNTYSPCTGCKKYELVGITRSEEKRDALEKAGAVAAVVDVLDAQALTQTLRQVHPDAVVHLATALPKHGPTKPSDMKATNELRVRATAHLLQASITAGVKRIVAESMTLPRRHLQHDRAHNHSRVVCALFI
jgi:uncharacterized protein YbjT (DUF2867 family)